MVVRSGLVGTQGRDRHIVVWEYDWTIVVILRYNLTICGHERKMVVSDIYILRRKDRVEWP